MKSEEPRLNRMDDIDSDDPPAESFTGQSIKNSVQELLRSGVLEAERKPNLYRTATTSTSTINRILEPLDLQLKVDDIRGIAFLGIIDDYGDRGGDRGGDSERDEWEHSLVRRQRLTLEQSLLVAILRRFYVAHEMDAGIGATVAQIHLDTLMPELNLFLGETGSDSRNDKRLRQLLSQLRNHGLVSDVDSNDLFTIRPLIVHVANPENLQNLLAAFIAQVSRQEQHE